MATVTRRVRLDGTRSSEDSRRSRPWEDAQFLLSRSLQPKQQTDNDQDPWSKLGHSDQTEVLLLASWDGCDEAAPQAGWLRTTGAYCLTVLGPEIPDQAVGGATLHLKVLRQDCPPCATWSWLADGVPVSSHPLPFS